MSHDPDDFRGHHPGPDADRGSNDEEPDDGGWGRPGRRKERILHTRVTHQLSEEIRRVAEDLRVPVSNLVRNVLEEAFHVVEQVSDDVGGIVGEVIEEAERARERFKRRAWRHRDHWHEQQGRAEERRGAADREAAGAAAAPAGPSAAPAGDAPTPDAERGPRMAFPGVVGWQPLVLDVTRRCACDDRTLERGDDAWVGLTERGLSAIYLCGPCMTARRA